MGKNLFQQENGVTEVFNDGAAKVYKATSTTCDCTFYKEHQAPCYHVMFLRTNYDNISTFDASIFHARYFRSREEDILTPPTSNNGYEEEDISGNRIDSIQFNIYFYNDLSPIGDFVSQL